MRYRKATFYVYSGTGNSRRVATWLAEAAAEDGVSVTLGPLRGARPNQEIGDGQDALLGLVMPTHGFTAPWSVLRFALGLPRRDGTNALVVATRGGLKIGRLYTPGFEGSATLLVALILAAKGYRIRGELGVDMPSNWTALHPALPPASVQAILARAEPKTRRFAAQILAGDRVAPSWAIVLAGLLLLPISLGYLVVARLFLGKLFFFSYRCTGCGLCAAHCPNQAIEMRGNGLEARPYWTSRCETCMRCMGYCPEQAVEASHLLGVGTYVLARSLPVTAALVWLARRFPATAFLAQLPGGMVISTTLLAVVVALYPLFHRALRVAPVHRFFTYATLTHLYRRYREPGADLEDLDRRQTWN